MVYTIRQLRRNFKQALDEADEGIEVVIERRLNLKGLPTKRYRIVRDGRPHSPQAD